MIKKLLLSSILVSSTLTANEVSVFGAGDLDSKNPYGLNSAEKNILKNKKNKSWQLDIMKAGNSTTIQQKTRWIR